MTMLAPALEVAPLPPPLFPARNIMCPALPAIASPVWMESVPLWPDAELAEPDAIVTPPLLPAMADAPM